MPLVNKIQINYVQNNNYTPFPRENFHFLLITSNSSWSSSSSSGFSLPIISFDDVHAHEDLGIFNRVKNTEVTHKHLVGAVGTLVSGTRYGF